MRLGLTELAALFNGSHRRAKTTENIMPTSRRNQLVRSKRGLLLFFAVEIDV
jgi:hypothetical protein